MLGLSALLGHTSLAALERKKRERLLYSLSAIASLATPTCHHFSCNAREDILVTKILRNEGTLVVCNYVMSNDVAYKCTNVM